MYFEITRQGAEAKAVGARGPWKWRLVREPDNIVAYGEGYGSKKECEAAVASVMLVTNATPIRYDPGDN
ncbi:DUF1508 domain-containing protein [Sphingomonas tagetis]|uniref:DUF1508 domain-containing protein n=1 Tax=Sphingomonas tagetis TaxID=2949092 RepID=UPI00345E635D